MIRMATPEDVPELLEIYAPYIMTSTATFEYDVPCRKDFLKRFLTITAQFPWLVWEEEGRLLGYAYASAPFTRPAYSWCAEPTIYLRPEARGREIGRKLYSALEGILKKQGYQVLYALVSGENQASLRFHEKMGYAQKMELPHCGYKFERWISLIWLEKRVQFVENPGEFPVGWKSIVENAEKLTDILDNLSLS